MKTLKILAMVFIILGLTWKINAQSTSTRDINIPFSFYIDCIGENAVGSLTLHTVIHLDKEGNWTSYHYQPQGGVLIGEKTGTVYHTTGVTQEHWKSFSTNGSWTDTLVNKSLAVGTGNEGVKWGYRALWHITITKDGDVSVTVDNIEVVCK